MKSKEWLERALNSQDPINLFTDSWRGFNNIYYQNTRDSELNKIHNFLTRSVSEEVASEMIDNHTKEITYLISQPVIDMRGNGRDTTPSIEKYGISDSSTEKLKALFTIIYQIRCNLEHGQKSPSRERDIELCNSAWPLVAEIVDYNT